LVSVSRQVVSGIDKAKPSVKVGRKAMGLYEKTAGLPIEKGNSAFLFLWQSKREVITMVYD